MKIVPLAAAIAAVLVAGCSQPKPPECFSPEATTALRQIIAGMGEGRRYPRASKEVMASLITVEAAAPTAYDESIQRYTCQALSLIHI